MTRVNLEFDKESQMTKNLDLPFQPKYPPPQVIGTRTKRAKVLLGLRKSPDNEAGGMMKRFLMVGALVSLLVVSMSVSLWAQATAQISGAVQDQSGAVLPGVEITATQTETGVSRMTVSNETGYYVLPNLPLGPYR